MAAPKGNKFWLQRSKHGRDKIFSDASILWEAACEYFQWVEDNPLWEEKAFSYQGVVHKDRVAKMRAMTMDGLYLFLGISDETWRDYRKREDFIGIIRNIEKVIRDQKFSGAAADLLNANIIARDLGLKDVNRQELTGEDGGPVEITGIDICFVKPKEVEEDDS